MPVTKQVIDTGRSDNVGSANTVGNKSYFILFGSTKGPSLTDLWYDDKQYVSGLCIENCTEINYLFMLFV